MTTLGQPELYHELFLILKAVNKPHSWLVARKLLVSHYITHTKLYAHIQRTEFGSRSFPLKVDISRSRRTFQVQFKTQFTMTPLLARIGSKNALTAGASAEMKSPLVHYFGFLAPRATCYGLEGTTSFMDTWSLTHY